MIDIIDSISQTLFKQYEFELSQIKNFFEKEQYTNIFSRLFLYSKNKLNALELDVRNFIIGVKAPGERLCYYSTKGGTLRIKISQTETVKTSLLTVEISELYSYIDQAEYYFIENGAESAIRESSVSTRNEKELKEHQFYIYIEESYQANHQMDGKISRAPRHAQKCTELLRDLNALLANNGVELDIFETKMPSELTPVYRYLKKSKDKIQKTDLKWYYYVLKRYVSFLDNDSSKKTSSKKGRVAISQLSPKLIETLEQEIKNLFAICHSNFIVVSKLYGRMTLLHKTEMQALGERCSANDLFRICKRFFSNQFYFNEPYILKERIAVVGNETFILSYIQSLDEFTLLDINRYIENMHLKHLTRYLDLMCACSETYVQVHKERMVSKNKISLSNEFLEQLKQELKYYIESFGPIESETYQGYNSLPTAQYPWSKYLLLGIVRSYFGEDFSIYYRDKSYSALSYLIDEMKKEY